MSSQNVVAFLTRDDSTAAGVVRVAGESRRAVAVRNVTGDGTGGSIATSSGTRIPTAPIDAAETGRTLRIGETFRPTSQLSRTGETGQTDTNSRSARYLTAAVGLAR